MAGLCLIYNSWRNQKIKPNQPKIQKIKQMSSLHIIIALPPSQGADWCRWSEDEAIRLGRSHQGPFWVALLGRRRSDRWCRGRTASRPGQPARHLQGQRGQLPRLHRLPAAPQLSDCAGGGAGASGPGAWLGRYSDGGQATVGTAGAGNPGSGGLGLQVIVADHYWGWQPWIRITGLTNIPLTKNT